MVLYAINGLDIFDFDYVLLDVDFFLIDFGFDIGDDVHATESRVALNKTKKY